jgi:hypothetical protein
MQTKNMTPTQKSSLSIQFDSNNKRKNGTKSMKFCMKMDYKHICKLCMKCYL